MVRKFINSLVLTILLLAPAALLQLCGSPEQTAQQKAAPAAPQTDQHTAKVLRISF